MHFLFRINTALKMVNNMQFFFRYTGAVPNYKLLVPLHFHKFPFRKRLFWVQSTRVQSTGLAVMCATQCYLLCLYAFQEVRVLRTANNICSIL